MRTVASKYLIFILFIAIAVLTEAGCGGKGGKGGGRYNEKPCEDNVASPTGSPTISPVPTFSPSKTSVPSRAPSKKPSVFPSASPSIKPSATQSASPSFSVSPSVVSSGKPSESPSVSPSSTPTLSFAPSTSNVPTKTAAPTSSFAPTTTPSPTKSFSPTTSAAPTSSFAPITTASPTKSPSPTATAAPTTSPSPTRSNNPTVDVECDTNSDGFFGETMDSSIVVKFGYELESTTSQVEEEEELILELERAFNEAILPALFTECAADDQTRAVTAAVKGVSARPDDIVFNNVVCQASNMVDANNRCSVVSGELTVYFEGDAGNIESVIIDLLKKAMERNDFLAVDKDIVRVTYVVLESDARSENPGGAGTQDPTGDDDRRGLIFGVVAGVATLLLILLGLVWRKKKQNDDDESQPSEPTPDPDEV